MGMRVFEALTKTMHYKKKHFVLLVVKLCERKKKIDDKEIQRLHFEEKIRPTEIARRLGIGSTADYRAISKDNKAT